MSGVDRRPDDRRTASIIIRTKNEERWLGTTLRAILTQSILPVEIFVIDSGSTDDTLTIARRFPEVTVLLISPQEWGYSRAINRAASKATGEILVVLSAHCPPVDERWLASLLAPFDDPIVAGVWGPSLSPGRPRPIVGPPEYQEPGSYRYENRSWGLSNPNAAIRRELWEAFPFDESLPAAEDKAWGREAMARGYCIVYEPKAAVWHPTHHPLAAYRRNRAVQAGFAMMFPERRAQGVRPGALLRAFTRTVRFHVQNRDAAAFWKDAKRFPSLVAAVVGGMIGARGHKNRR